VGLSASSRALDPQQVQALDSTARALEQDAARRVEVRYTDPSLDRQSESWRFAQVVRDHLVLRRIAVQRIRLTRVHTVRKAGLPSKLDAVEVVVTRSPDDTR
jgi:hypothetical protein